MTQNKPMSILYKTANLMGYEFENHPDWNPLTSKSDLVDLICKIDPIINFIERTESYLIEHGYYPYYIYSEVELFKHPDKFTALAHAVCDVAEQIYDMKNSASQAKG